MFPLILAIVFIGFGLYTLNLRQKAPERFGKLEAMKKFYGEKRGDRIHFISYTVIPIIFGIAILIKTFL